MRDVDFLLVGGGMGSAYCAQELRRRGADGSILLVGREQDPPYERPPLSKEYLRGEAKREDALVNPREWYEENGVELLTGRSVMALDSAERVAKLQGGEEVRFGKALLATGAMVNILRVEGARARRDSLPAGVRQLGLDPRRHGLGGARGDDRRQLHRLRGGGVARGAGKAVHGGDAGGRGAVNRVRRGGWPLLPGRDGGEGDRVHRRRFARRRSGATSGSARS